MKRPAIVKIGNLLIITCAAAALLAFADDRLPSALTLAEDPETGGIGELKIAGDATEMNWVRRADGVEFKWIGPECKWGTGTAKADGKPVSWTKPSETKDGVATYRLADGLELVRVRRNDGGSVYERYALRNTGTKPMKLSEIDIHTPFRDDYLPAAELRTRRCHAHVWPGGSSAWVCALRMGGAAPHLGLAVVEGRITGYELKERGRSKGSSDTRGVIALSMPDVELAPGAETAVAWRLFPHSGKADFLTKVRRFGGVTGSAADWTVDAKTPVDVTFQAAEPCGLDGATVAGEGVKILATRREGNRLIATCAYERDGEARVVCRYGEGCETYAELLARGDPAALVKARADFIVRHQAYRGRTTDDPRDGALVEFDNETNEQYRRWEHPKGRRLEVDHNEGAERLAMGVFLARMAAAGHRDYLPTVERYAKFVREGLQDPDYTTWGEVDRRSRKRLFNYPWVAEFHLAAYRATGEKRHLLDAYGTMMRLFAQLGTLVVVESPEAELVRTLREAGCTQEATALLQAMCAHKDRILDRESAFDEVNFAPEGVAAQVTQFLGLWQLTGDEKYRRYAFEKALPMFEACLGPQPSWHSHDIGMHHWDGYWFGKRQCWGDTLPHDWNGTGADAFALLAEATGDVSYRARARAVVRQLLGLFDADGRAGCAWVLPDRVNGRPARFRDPLANDQDWALVFYLRNAAETFRELPVFDWDPGSDWVDVRSFGAKGDGTTDDTAALQAAFDRLDNGVVIYLPAGMYRITDTLRWCGQKSRLTNTAVIGCGEKTRIVWDGPQGGRMVKDSGLSLARYFGFVLDGRGKASVGLWNHQQNRFETQCRYSYLAFRDFDRQDGIGLLSENNSKDGQSDSEPTFENCIFDGMKTAISFTSHNDYDFAFRGCLFRQCGSGIYCCSGNFYASACRFEQNGVDVHCAPCPEHNSSVRRCVSVGSGAFLKGHANVASLTVENCTIADWKDKTAFDWNGPILAFNNTFHPGANTERYTIGMGDIYLRGVLQGGNTKVKGTHPALALPIESNFLKKSIRYPRKCFDVRRDFGAKGDGKTDDTAAFRAAIAAAKAHGKDAIAYVPRGRFRVTETLVLDGGGYMFGGNGAGSVVLWDGDRAKNAIEIVNPRDLVLWQIRVDCIDTVDNQTAKWNGEKGANICQRGSANGADGVRALPSTLNSQPSTVTYCGVFCYGKYQGRGMAERQGFLFKDLGSADVVNVPYAEGNIRLENCGESTVLFGVAHEGSITVDGPTGKGFLGGCARLSTHCAAPLQVRKNGSFVWSDYYLEQGYDTLVALSGGPRWPKGRVTVGFPKFARTQNAAETAAKTNLYHYVSIDNYQGEFDIASIQVYPVYDKTNTMWIDNVGTGAAVNFAAPVYYRFNLGADAGVVVNQFAHRPMNTYGTKDDAFLANLYDDLTRLGEIDLQLNFR